MFAFFPYSSWGDETLGRSLAALQAKHANQAVNMALLRFPDTADWVLSSSGGEKELGHWAER